MRRICSRAVRAGQGQPANLELTHNTVTVVSCEGYARCARSEISFVQQFKKKREKKKAEKEKKNLVEPSGELVDICSQGNGWRLPSLAGSRSERELLVQVHTTVFSM